MDARSSSLFTTMKPITMACYAVGLATLISSSCGNMYDVVSGWKVPGQNCPNGCAPWSKFANVTQSWWHNDSLANSAGNSCAQLAGAPGLSKPSPVLDPRGVGGFGAWCFCAESDVDSPVKDSPAYDYCDNPYGIPSQINIQIAAPLTVVLSFVTFEKSAPANPPIALFGTDPSSLQPATGDAVTHTYVKDDGKDPSRTYYMHFVVLSGLTPRTRYFYKVKSGGVSQWSDVYSFRSGYTYADSDESNPTRVAIFGDMGVYTWNNMINLKADVENQAIDLVVHMGDHCYNIGGDNDRRGDGYMEAYQPVISQVPWLPIVGNHEFYDGDELRRYLNQTEGTVVANPVVATPPDHPFVAGASTSADSALGRMLATGNHHGAAQSHSYSSSVPSGTSRWYSVDFGLIHFVALDLNMYNAVDLCGDACRQAQLAWLEKDLMTANANRAQVPWIVAMSHFPLYCSNCPGPGRDPPGAWFQSETCEFTGHNSSCIDDEWTEQQQSLKQRLFGKRGSSSTSSSSSSTPGNDDMVPDFEPLFMKYGVDVYSSGHIHDYEYIYPTFNNTPVQTNFENPRAPVHLVTGNGGPPSRSNFGKIAPWSFLHSNVYSYTRLEVYNSSTMKWIQVANNDSTVLTELVVTQNSHGAFPIPV